MLLIVGHLGLGFWVAESRLQYLEEEVFFLDWVFYFQVFIVQCTNIIGNAKASALSSKGSKREGVVNVSIYVWRWAERRLELQQRTISIDLYLRTG